MSDKQVIIFGGDPAGVAAAIEQAEAGRRVVLVESSPALGAERIPQTHLLNGNPAWVDPNLRSGEKTPEHPHHYKRSGGKSRR